MADPTLRLTFTQLRTRIAEYLGIAPLLAGVASIPTDAHDLDLVGRLVNEGYRRFISESDRWNFLTVPFNIRFKPQQTLTITASTLTTITIGAYANIYANDFFNGWEVTVIDEDGLTTVLTVSDYTGTTGVFTFAAVPLNSEFMLLTGSNSVEGLAWRQYLPADFYGIMETPFTYDQTGPRVNIVEITEPELRELRAGTESTGTPEFVAFRAINTTASSTVNRWEALFWPQPVGNEIVTATYKRFPQALANTGDVSVAGYQHDQTILLAALAAAELHRNDRIGMNEQAYQQALTRSRRIDARASSPRGRPYGDKSDGVGFSRPSSYYQVDDVGGIEID